jgi:HK97 family phage portal protein
MGLVSRTLNLFGLQKRSVSNLVTPQPWMFGGASFGGVKGMNVNRNTALSISAVYRAVDLISGVIASIPFYVYKKEGENRKRDLNHIVSRRFNRSASSWMNSYDFKKTLAVHLLIDGNAYVWIKPDGAYKLLDYRQVYPFLFEDEKFYRVTSIKGGVLSDSEVLHFKGISFGADGAEVSQYSEGLKGVSPISATYDIHSGALAETVFSNKFFENGANPSGVIEHPELMTDTSYNRLKTSFDASYGGLNNVGKTVVLEQGGKYKQISINPRDAMLIEKKKLTVEDIARVYGVPPHLLYNLDRATYNSVENLSTEFVKYTIKPRLEALESEIDFKYFGDDLSYEVRADIDSLLRGDSAARAEFYRTLFNSGAMSPNEIRAREGTNPYEGGNQKFIQVNMMPVVPEMKNPHTENTGE